MIDVPPGMCIPASEVSIDCVIWMKGDWHQVKKIEHVDNDVVFYSEVEGLVIRRSLPNGRVILQ